MRAEVLRRVLDEELSKPYDYGVSDCFMVGCRVADALCPSRPSMVDRYSGRYRTLLGAQRALRREGCSSLSELLGRHLKSCAPASMILGDLAVLELEDGEHVAVHTGQRLITKTAAGREVHDLGSVVAAFRT